MSNELCDKILKIRINSKLKSDFKEICDINHVKLSSRLRFLIKKDVSEYTRGDNNA